MRKSILLTVAILIFTASPAAAQRARAQDLIDYFRQAETWAMKAIILIALTEAPHPKAMEAFDLAFRDKDKHVQIFGAEALDRMPEDVLRAGASRDFMDFMINKVVPRMTRKHEYFQERIISILQKITGENFGPKGRAKWRRYWKGAKDSYQPSTWGNEEPPRPPGPGNAGGGGKPQGTVAFIRNLINMNEHGLQLVIVLDSTGSMQTTIDGARAGIDKIATVLQGVVPNFRIGLVTYQDYEDMPSGARRICSLTKSWKSVKSQLGSLKAKGGGDFPERVEKGLGIALRKGMGWKRQAAKVVIIMGDAPPHASALEEALKLAREAHVNPFGGKRLGTATGARAEPATPFLISCVAVPFKGGPINSRTSATFRQIAAAGGGTYTSLGSADQIVRQVLMIAFGKKWEKEASMFLRWYDDLRAKGLFGKIR